LAKTNKKVQSRRTYDNKLRLESSAQNKKLIIETLVALLVETRGGDVTFKEIAKRSGLAERSIYRFYNDKEQLHEEMDRYLTTYIESSVEQLATMDVAKFARNAFQLFDQYEALVLAYLYSPFGQDARILFRKKLDRIILRKIQQEKPGTSPKREKRVALICSMINAKLWQDVRQSFGFSGVDMGESVEWAIRTLISDL
jgi:AcrR family transcriptional regulator